MYDSQKEYMKFFLGDNLYCMMKNHHCMIAGGMITSIFTHKEINDIDVYFKNKNDLFDFLFDLFLDKSNKFGTARMVSGQAINIIYVTEKSVTIAYDRMYENPTFYKNREESVIKIQFVFCNFYNSSFDIFNDFDFTINMGAYDFDSESFVFHSNFFIDNSMRKLSINTNTKYPFITVKRMFKYIDKGYTISSKEIFKILLSIRNLDIQNWDDFNSQLGGMYGESIDIEIPENTEYSDELALSIIEKTKFRPSTLAERQKTILLRNDKIISDIAKKMNYEKIVKCISNDGNVGLIKTSDGYSIYSIKDGDFIKWEKDNNGFPIVMYKYVNDVDGKLLSPMYGQDFEYKLNTVVEAKNSGSNTYGIYLSDLKNTLKRIKGKKKAVILKCVIMSPDDVIYSDDNVMHGTVRAKRCYVAEIVERKDDV